MKLIKTLFLDIGGVLLTNGWDTPTRSKAIAHFKLDADQTQERHHMVFDTFESGKMTLDAYLDYVIFYEVRSFTKDQFVHYMHEQSQRIENSIEFFKAIKAKYTLRVIAISNEPRELNNYRIRHFKLMELFDAVISSSFVHLRKPDVAIFKLAIDIAQSEENNALYIDDRQLFIEIARGLGVNGIQFTDLEEVKNKLKDFDLSLE
ncbi:MAG: HAD hydrolase-like protein [Bacteroidia bacterium]